MSNAANRTWVIWLSLLVATILTLLPLPELIAPARPAWLTLVLIYWVLALPERASVGIAFLFGIMLDVLQGVMLGQNALALTVVAFVCVKLHRRLRLFPLMQQALVVFVIVGLHQLILLWLGSLVGEAPPQLWFLLTALVSALLWPWIYILLREVRQRYRVR